MTQPYPLRNMTCTSSPHHGVLERLFQSPMHLVTNLFDRRFIPYDQGFAEVGFFSLAFDWLAKDFVLH